MLRNTFCSSNVFSLLYYKVTMIFGDSLGFYEDCKHISLVKSDISYYLEG